MKKEYWLERWERDDIAFHQDEINPYLREYWPALHLEKGSKVLVPLCGKSRDMLWLREQGHPVLGAEASPVAVQAFFEEQSLAVHPIPAEKFDRYEADRITILCGDVFDLTKDDLREVRAVYDRGSLIALPLEMRRRYARHMVSILPSQTQILLITLDYPQPEMQGPPFAVSENEVYELYRGNAKIDLLARRDVLAQNPRFQQRGLSRLLESIFLLKFIEQA